MQLVPLSVISTQLAIKIANFEQVMPFFPYGENAAVYRNLK